MAFYKYLLIIHVFVIISIFSLCDQVNGGFGKSDTYEMKPPDRILSRKRRYLIFPKGSSIQLVYDSAATIPDYTLLIVTGITTALAWGLPHQPVYPEDELMGQYEKGRLPLIQYRKDENVTESTYLIDKPSKAANTNINNENVLNLINLFYQSVHRQKFAKNNYTTGNMNYMNKYNYNGNHIRRNDPYYYGNTQNMIHSPATSNANDYYFNRNGGSNGKISYSTDNGNNNNVGNVEDAYNVRPPLSPTFATNKNHYDIFTNYVAENYFKPWLETDWPVNKDEKKSSAKVKIENKASTSTTTEYKPVINKLHTVFVAMGKRSISNEHRTYEQKFYIDRHRSTRHDLFKLVEKYLFAKGYNGTACVLKTLCEVGQKRHEKDPGSFLAEITRALFSLPEAQLTRVIDKRHIHYDSAHQSIENCTETFKNCPESIWNAEIELAINDEDDIDNEVE